ncbi:glycosyltransferase [Litoreibacter albidus]|uniref:glycosyltransferase n=1 Tax=Litoreibacter albidus TaxID=670155 RepID=UPI00111490DA|nr:glycosyltransferase [Litoreibacter albidus]
MTRFEAMGWAAYSGHRAEFPATENSVMDVFQFWDHSMPPKEILDAKQLWVSCAEEHVWYDDQSARDFIREGFGDAAAKAYSELWHPALKSDVFRLYRLAKCGGLYCDADSKPEYRIPEFLRCGGERVWASSMTNVPNCVVNNWFVAAPPCHPFIEAMLDQVLRNIHDIDSRGIFWLSGPGAFTTFLYQNIGKYDVGLLPQSCLKSELFRQFDADYKHTEQNWRVYEHKLGLDNDSGLTWALRNV